MLALSTIMGRVVTDAAPSTADITVWKAFQAVSFADRIYWSCRFCWISHSKNWRVGMFSPIDAKCEAGAEIWRLPIPITQFEVGYLTLLSSPDLFVSLRFLYLCTLFMMSALCGYESAPIKRRDYGEWSTVMNYALWVRWSQGIGIGGGFIGTKCESKFAHNILWSGPSGDMGGYSQDVEVCGKKS